MPELPYPRHEVFARADAINPNATQSALKAGYSPKGARKSGHELLQRPEMKARLAELTKPIFDALDAEAERVMKRITDMATVDLRALTQYHVGCCRYCHGDNDHAYQWKTGREFREAEHEARKKRGGADDPEYGDDPTWPTVDGGFGYDLTRAPDPQCPECNGLGRPYVTATPTKDLSAVEALMFLGAKHGPHGIEILTADRHKALEMVAKRHGLLKETAKADEADSLTKGLAEILGRMTAAAPLRKQYDS